MQEGEEQKADYKQHTVAELKQMCRERGLKVGGRKAELIARFEGAPSEAGTSSSGKVKQEEESAQAPPVKRARTTTDTGERLNSRNIREKLKAAGFKTSRRTSHCAMKALAKGRLRWNGTAEELDQPAVVGKDAILREEGTLLEVKGLECGHTWHPTLRQLLLQTDYPGTDFEKGRQSTTIICPHMNDKGSPCQDRIYLTQMCIGMFKVDSGKFHNHCTNCNGLGKCIGDYRISHCDLCGRHWRGPYGVYCNRCAG